MQEYIEIQGARENNLKNVSLRIPKRQITIFTGVSGSGKSSIVFDTVAAEAQRLLNETFSAFIRGFLPKVSQPDADAIANLNMAVIVDQKRLGGGSSSTVGTATDIAPIVRTLFAKAGQPNLGHGYMFSFNNPAGMCQTCDGLGQMMALDLDKAYDYDASLNDGAIQLPDYKVGGWGWKVVVKSGLFDNDKKLSDFTDKEMHDLNHAAPFKVDVGGGLNIKFTGVIDEFSRKYIKRDLKSLSERTQKTIEPFMNNGPCESCHGSRLSQQALVSTIHGRTIAELSAMQIDELIEVLDDITETSVKPVIDMLRIRLQHLIDIGLDYLSLDRVTDTLSGGESQRVKLVKYLNGTLNDVMYIFDEPSVGLHPRDVHRLNDLLKQLRDNGNTVIVVEHDPDVIKVADYIVDVGPHAGSKGGNIVFEGSYKDLLKADTLTGRFLSQTLPIKAEPRKATGLLAIEHATVNNLQDVSVAIQKGILNVVTGVAGSGKSSLINQTFVRQYPDSIVIDQSAIGVNSRSNPATYTGIMDVVRKNFAAANKVEASLFSFNSKGGCENCQGTGYVTTDLAFLDEQKQMCEICEGKRFKEEVLAYTLNGKSITDVLAMTIAESLEFFEDKEISKKLQAMNDVGLSYLTLGQPLSTLSGGECQRIKLAGELHKKGSIYVMDEPTTGLHTSDIQNLLDIINRLVDTGNTVVVIEHNLDVIRQADWIIDIGPEGGKRGGRVLFEGIPADLKQSKESLTAEYI
ncbi:thiamine ABC transporter permease [Candidatus Saccharibacteria bacterium RIFCSPHIGHO2_01_FULL_45_15]|nr:MAG: thiamine ABC transporter permease [Candidatus Saccharibacteria bacterium RIFCSPHIGHO2_01_FULL_45_15]OGL32684.1 MAG: thiamine ABC transporter permease [Candidatus Saccharibacteria bacterium RIFCSPHIGHO2_12_FULL_44_22]